MKLKLVLVGLVMLGSAGCVTSTNSYTRDIVYRDGSYYSPADEQNGDYYYEPEPEYSYYDDYPYYGYGYNSNYWYGHHDSYRCRFSYRYCNSSWNNFFLGFGGLTIIFGNSNYYGYPYYGYYDPYYYYGGYHYYGHHHSPRPGHHHPVPMPKPTRPSNQIPDNSISNRPAVRVAGEPIRMPTKPGLLDQDPAEPIVDTDSRADRNPYTRTREPRQRVRPEIWRNANGNTDSDEIVIRETRQPRPNIREDNVPVIRNKPVRVIDSGEYSAVENPIRQERHPQPHPINGSSSDPRPQIAAPRAPPRERIERTERSEREVPAARQISRNEGSDDH